MPAPKVTIPVTGTDPHIANKGAAEASIDAALEVLYDDIQGRATSAQGEKADTAVQPGDIGTAAAENVTAFATAAQGSFADTALQPGASIDVLAETPDAKIMTADERNELAGVPAAIDVVAQRISPFEASIKLDGESFKVIDEVGFEIWDFRAKSISTMGYEVLDFSQAEAFRIVDPYYFELWRFGNTTLSSMGNAVLDFKNYNEFRVVDPVGFEVFSVNETEIRHMGSAIAVDYDPAVISGITQLTPRPIQKWRKARAGVIQDLSRARIACIGDSNTMGYSALGGALHRRAYSYPAALARIAAEYRPSWANVFGDALSGTATTAAAYRTYDPRVLSVGSGWDLTGPDSLGGSMWVNSTTTGVIVFDPGMEWSTADVWVACSSGASLEIGVENDMTAFSPAADTIVKLTYSAGVPSGADALRIARTAGSVQVIGWHCYDNTVSGLDIFNLGSSGWRSDEYADATNYYSPVNAVEALDADLWLLQLGLNDFNQNRAPVDFRSSMATILDKAAAIGVPVVLIVSMTPSGTKAFPWSDYVDVLYDLGKERGHPILDIGTRFGPYADAFANGLVDNSLHPNAYGYGDTARFIYNLINE